MQLQCSIAEPVRQLLARSDGPLGWLSHGASLHAHVQVFVALFTIVQPVEMQTTVPSTELEQMDEHVSEEPGFELEFPNEEYCDEQPMSPLSMPLNAGAPFTSQPDADRIAYAAVGESGMPADKPTSANIAACGGSLDIIDMESSKDILKDTDSDASSKDMGSDSSKDMSSETSKDASTDSSKDMTSESSSTDPSKDTTTDSSKDISSESLKEACSVKGGAGGQCTWKKMDQDTPLPLGHVSAQGADWVIAEPTPRSRCERTPMSN